MCLIAQQLSGAEIQLLSKIKFKGKVLAADNISAVAVLGDGEFLVIGSDEGTHIQVLRRTNDNEYTVHHNIRLAQGDTGKEIDVEGIASSGDRLYIVGSHSRKRLKIKPSDNTQQENHELLEGNVREELRENLFELRLNAAGEPTSDVETKSLRPRIASDPVLRQFLKIPSKENGVDIEGIAAAHGDELYVGFRGPVLREGYVPILVFDFDKPQKAKTVYVKLGGRGIRDLVRVSDGFLIIGGPVGGEPVTFEIYHWDGEDCMAGSDNLSPKDPKSLGVIPLPNDQSKAEGIAVVSETDTHYDVLIVFDGPTNGQPTQFRVEKQLR
ncbi:hypothetical protein Pla8534_19010 [Lignipirellula cremea]|uniref:DUF3616 domain-containing protein n=2 Tax=Lignipirellula cremea TaxID=2528010 RepID=A0A518DQJ7_9BACT|nr:hypothetical protein Pla8534_19010 [Lignipirellula cremea]